MEFWHINEHDDEMAALGYSETEVTKAKNLSLIHIWFSEAAKERMARNLVAAQGASHAPAASATRQARERTLVRARVGGKRRWQAVAAAAAAVGVLAVLGGAAYASGALMTMAEAVDAALTGAPAPTEIVDKVGRPVGAGASSNGVTVTAEAIFGDRENYAIVYSIAKDDGTAFDLPPKTDSGTLPLRFQEGSPTASVSDTDVYKRQAMDCSTSSARTLTRA